MIAKTTKKVSSAHSGSHLDPGAHSIKPDTVVASVCLPEIGVQPLCRFKDNRWTFPDDLFPKYTPRHAKAIQFDTVPQSFIYPLKLAIYRYYCNGSLSSIRPRGGSIIHLFKNAKVFLEFMHDKGIDQMKNITPLIASHYAQHCRQLRTADGAKVSDSALIKKIVDIETLFKLLCNTPFAFPHPWEDSSAQIMAGIATFSQKAKTPEIPQAELTLIVRHANDAMNTADRLLGYRDQTRTLLKQGMSRHNINIVLEKSGFVDGLRAMNEEINRLQSACLIIILAMTGLRAHELANLEHGCADTSSHEGQTYYWIKGYSDKTYTGHCRWMCPLIVHRAVAIAQRIAVPQRQALQSQIKTLVKQGQHAKATDLKRHEHTLFLSVSPIENNEIKTFSLAVINYRIKRFASYWGISWTFSSHQFRRSFAVAIAAHTLGDLRYLKEHFKHWSIDMTALYAAREDKDGELLEDIVQAVREAKRTQVSYWFEPDHALSGGLAQHIGHFRDRENNRPRTAPSHKALVDQISDHVFLRATGVAWCTADAVGCHGGTVAAMTQCADCSGSIIDERFLPRWEAIYVQHNEILQRNDIGQAGREQAKEALLRCEKVLTELGADLSRIRSKYFSEKVSWRTQDQEIKP